VQMLCAPDLVKMSLARAISAESSVWTEMRMLLEFVFDDVPVARNS